MIRQLKWLLLLIAALLIGVAVASRHWHRSLARISQSDPSSISISGNTMGGTWSVKLTRLPPGVSPEALEQNISQLLSRLDSQMSIWKPQSELSRFNQYRGTDWVAVPRELAEVVAVAQAVSAQTDGAFDVTVGPLVLMWGFGPQKAGGQIGQIPSDPEIAAACAHVGYRLLDSRLSPPGLRKSDPQVYVDLGGVAKGYAAQAVADQLKSMGATDYLVAIGGELRSAGRSPGGAPWRVGIETPTPDVRRVFYSLDLTDASLSTSGDYRNFFEKDGTRYCHEIDPHTGRPIPAGLASVSIVHPSGAYADAMATALMVLGPREGFDLACRMKLAVLFIIRKADHFETIMTPDFARIAGSGAREGDGK